jgi:hypothetical protein
MYLKLHYASWNCFSGNSEKITLSVIYYRKSGLEIALYEWGTSATGIRSWCPAPSINLKATSVRLAVPSHGAVDFVKIDWQHKKHNGKSCCGHRYLLIKVPRFRLQRTLAWPCSFIRGTCQKAEGSPSTGIPGWSVRSFTALNYNYNYCFFVAPVAPFVDKVISFPM